MKCQNCNNRDATTHIKRVINGAVEEYNLCSECAAKLGYGNVFSEFKSPFSDSFGSFLGSFFENALPARTQATRCETCGATYSDIQRTGMMGCADCYTVFRDEIMPTIRRVHGNTVHSGKNSPTYKKQKAQQAQAKEAEQPLSELEKLRAELDRAISSQEFESAASLRDRIKELEGNDE